MSTTQKRKRQDSASNDHNDKKLAVACTACRKQKIRCDMIDEEPPCRRCQKKGFTCILHTPLRNPAADHRQLGLLGKDMTTIHSTLGRICTHLGIEQPSNLLSATDSTVAAPQPMALTSELDDADEDSCELSSPVSPSNVQAPMDTYLATAQRQSPLDRPSPLGQRRRISERPDLTSKGLVSLEEAARLVQHYLSHLDPFLYGICAQYKDVHHVRRASPTLLAAMCAIAAFQEHKHQDLFQVCYKEYRALVSASMFEKRGIDFVRALCIGSFWLPDASRILLSDAIRRAADLRLHRCFHRIADTDYVSTSPSANMSNSLQARDHVRLWYLLFVCDQHLSILHNRDPVMRTEKEAIEHKDTFLVSEAISPFNDIRLVSQVALLHIMNQVREIFSSEHATPVAKNLSVQFTHFSRELDQWFAKWSPLFEPDPNIGSFPLSGLTMHYHFAKLYLGHHVFRGLQNDLIPIHFMTAATTAREAAIMIFTMINDDITFQSHLVGMPHYFHIMISFAGHFLLEVCRKYREQLSILVEQDLQCVGAALSIFAKTPAMAQHPISRVTVGLLKKLDDCRGALGMASDLQAGPFGRSEHAAERETGTGGVDSSVAPVFDLQLSNGLPDDFWFGGLGDFTFPDPGHHFVS